MFLLLIDVFFLRLTGMLTQKISPSSPGNSVFIGHASNPS
jgi:hypothetical protein